MANIVRRNVGSSIVPRTTIDPFDVMRELLSFDPLRALFAGGTMREPSMTTFLPQFEVRETKDAYVFKGDLPGVRDEDLDITMAQNRLTISGRREMEHRDEQDRYYAYERSYGSFTRTFTLPDQTDGEHVKAELKNGELTVVVPKTPAAVAKKIPVSSGDKPKT